MFTREIQEKVCFRLDLDQMKILPATAEIMHCGIIIGQIRKADFGVRFELYQESIAAVELKLLMNLNRLNT